MTRRSTIEDVARAAGVSRQTVSRAVNNKDGISAVTRERVMTIVRELDYRPNRLAQGMVTQRTRTVGLILGDITNPFFPEVTRGVQDAAQSNDYNVFLCNTDDRLEIELQELHSLAAQGVDGIILFSHHASDEELRNFANMYHPIVIINRQFEHPNVSMVMVNNLRGAQLATRYLIDQGHTCLGMLTNDAPTFSKSRRVYGFRQEISQRGLTVEDGQIIAAPATLEGGYRAAKQLFARYPAVTGIFTYNDLMAIGGIRACQELGLAIPGDVALIGFDDIRFAAMVTPSLSSIRVDKYAIGHLAMERLLEMLAQPDVKFPPIDIDVELVARESTGAHASLCLV